MSDEVPRNAGGLLAGVAAGSRLGGYLLEEEIGAGGMAVVFRARDERLDRPVALKLLAPGLATDEEFRRRFLHESRAAAAVDDPHIIPVYEAGQARGVLFLAMRFVSGGDVRGLLRREGPLPAGRVAAIISPVASALDAAHVAGLVHRDVKPGNMLIDARPGRPDHVYLSDFGLARAGSASALTGTGVYLGTAGYMAPEQVRGGVVDGRADQYALGCAVFELLCGKVPFERDQDMAVLYAHLSVPPPSLASRRAGLPAACDEVLARALAKAPEDRYPSCREFAEALRQALGLPGYDHDAEAVPASAAAAQAGLQVAGAPGATVIRPAAGAADRGTGELPGGIVTFLFSDIEGSAVLLGRLGEAYGEVLSAQRAIMRAAIAGSQGRELGTKGDSFFVVFSSAADAVRCCVAAQRALAGYDWPGDMPVRVRMGLHAGEPARHEGSYIGLDVHRAARIAAAAHGGQVVASDATRLLAAFHLASEVSFRDLGFHRLKDIEAPEHIFQLAAAGLPERFPPLRSLGALTSFPVPVTPLVGREAELAALRATVARPGVRLVTLTGPGGIGKTRLALAAAGWLHEAFPHGGYFVPLAPVRDAEVMWKAIAASLDVSGDGPDADTVTGFLAERRALVVLDNLEQLHGAASVVAGLLGAAPRLVILATSRRPLHVLGEHELPVPPLAVPEGASAAEVAGCGAPMLFAQQAQLVRPGFAITESNAADVAAICARLDGLPLAIELAASRARLLSPKALLARLGRGLALAAADAGRPQRQQTLRDTIAWSYELLSRALAAAFRRMGVFAGGCDLDALAAVAGAGLTDGGEAAESGPLELAAELQDLSLITVTEGRDGEPRLGMLETIRAFALERLAETGELDEACRRHAAYYAAFAERTHGQSGGPEELAALDRLEAEHANLRAALNWALDTPAEDPAERAERAATGLRLAHELGYFWYKHGHATEGRQWLERAIELAPHDAGAPLARAVHGLGMLLAQQGENRRAAELLQRNLALWRELGDREQQARELNAIGAIYRDLGDLDAARSLLEESADIGRKLGSDFRVGIALTNLGQVESEAGNLDRATELLREALALGRKLGNEWFVAVCLQSLAEVSLRADRPKEARDLLPDVVDYAASSGDTEFLAYILETAACITAALGDGPRAARLTGAAETLRQQAGMLIPPTEAALLERFLTPARAATLPTAWSAELAAGRALSEHQAADLLRSALQRA